MLDQIPEIVQVAPQRDHTVLVYFVDGKIVRYDVRAKLESGVFGSLKDIDVFMNCCRIMNDTLAWDVAGNADTSECIDIDPYTLYALDSYPEPSKLMSVGTD